MKLFELFGLEWSNLTPVTRLLLIFQLITFSISMVRLTRWLVRMHRKRSAPIESADSVQLIEAALSGRVFTHSTRTTEIPQAVQRDVRQVFEACRIDVDSAGRHCVLILLLSVVSVTFSVYPMLDRLVTQSGRLTPIALLSIGQPLLGFLSFGGGLGAALYALLGTTARLLHQRKSTWRRFMDD